VYCKYDFAYVSFLIFLVVFGFVLKLEVKVPKSCEVACVRKLKKSERRLFQNAIFDEYKVFFVL
jgi:hypothetical protein